MSNPFASLPKGYYGAILADPPWRYRTWDNREAIKRTRGRGTNVSVESHYGTMSIDDICSLPLDYLAADDCDCVHSRVERLVAGPYLELFARQRRSGWDSWGNEIDKFGEYDPQRDLAGSIDVGFAAIRERVANGGPGWGEERK